MKVGILTLPLWNNYGGILQAYALQLAVERLGHNAVFIDVKRDSLSIAEYGFKQAKRWVRSTFFGGINKSYYPSTSEMKNISFNTRRFVEENMKPSSGHIPLSFLPEFSKSLDAIIVGSDQVWRPEYCPSLELYFLGFADTNLKKISYAASLGTSDWRFNHEDTLRCGKLLNDFHAISVREDSAVALIQKNMGLKAVQVCDPTLLLEAQDYLRLAGIKLNSPSGGRGVFCYVLDPNESRIQGLQVIGSELGFTLFHVMPKVFDRNYRKSPEDYTFPTVESWIQAFHDSDFVITDSFHGCVFSIIFNKPFVAIANTDRGRARFESLLALFGLEERLFENVESIDRKIMNKKPDWERVNKTRKSLRSNGIKFLIDALNLDLQ